MRYSVGVCSGARVQPILFQFVQSDEHLSIPAGDVLAVDLRQARMWTSRRILHPNYGYLAHLITIDVIRLVTPSEAELVSLEPPRFPLQVVA